ncbi:AAA family ATPase [Rhizobiales bacterium RZME27]|uniref:AAA family ATPase n=1 Tax=Endobacterium cereale TaxID=2663029 RepID=A0A6A8A5G2_9HYPH|nr:AAA family ATPase [Endobacterium cereale]MEB2844598.1 AAA family ATPase [Endobacterium cereale]MQY45087.1 AAA family ATPase [Endobacterium cereale]
MRLNRLDLTRYGKFTDHVIDFGKVTAGQPDLHIIYGLNEAGKSTMLAAYLDLLFGMHTQTPYNFLHSYSAMRIGAQLEIDDAAHELARLKQRSGSLIDASGSPVNDALLVGALGGVTRDAYRTMFSLDDASLAEGGNAIIQSKGELGELLFSASSGLAGLSKALAAAGEEAAGFHKKRSSSTKLAELKRALETLKTERNAIDTFATAYSSLNSAHETAKTAYDGATAELAEARTRHGGLNRILTALPLSLELARLQADPSNQAELPRPPAEWFTLLPQLMRDETRLQALLKEKDRAIKQVQREIDGMTVDEEARLIAVHEKKLVDGISRFRAADEDLPKRRQSLAEQDGALARLLADLERPPHDDAEALLLPASTTAIIRDLIEKRSGIDVQLSTAEREFKRSRDALERLRERETIEAAAGEALDDFTLDRLETALARLTSSDLPSRLALEERGRTQLQRNLENRIGMLSPWTGDMNALAATRAADARQIETWRAHAIATDRRLSDHQARLRELQTEQVSMQARLAAFHAGGAINDTEAQAARGERDDAWQTHLTKLDDRTARIFEEAMHRDDGVSAGRLARAHELAELRQLTRKTAENKAGIEYQRDLLAEAEGEHATLSEKIGALLAEASEIEMNALDRIAALESWTTRRAEALSAWEQVQQAQADIIDVREELDGICGVLHAALSEAGARGLHQLTPVELARGASDFLSRIKAGAHERAAHEKSTADLSRDITERERARQDAQLSADRWQDAWQQVLSKTWLAEHAHSVAAIGKMLSELSKLPAILKDRQDLAQRVYAMERDQTQFRDEVSALLRKLDDDGSMDDPLVITGQLLDRLKTATRDEQARTTRHENLEKLRVERMELAGELAVHEAQKTRITAYFGTDTLAAVESFLEQARERDRIEARIAELKAQIAQSLQVAHFDDATRTLAEIDAGSVEREAEELSTRIADLTDRTRELYAETTRAKDKLDAVGGDDAVAQIEAKRRTVLLEVEDVATRYLTLRTGILAAEQALHIYREKHRSSMMNRASEAFSLITGGNYSGLTTQIDGSSEILIGVSRDGGSKLAKEMSTGTQFQLYLALRLAGYEEFAAVRPAVPFIADDIMESFDDQRSEEVFRLLGEMSKVGQVIYLTHHRHLCDIAKTVVPQVKIHQLP